MERSGVDVVLCVKRTFITEILNRLSVCKLFPIQIPSVELIPSDSTGEVIVKFLGISFAISTNIYQGNLRVYISLRETSAWLEDELGLIEDASPYELSLEMLEDIMPVKQCGLKIGGENGDLLLFGIEFEEGCQTDWNQFYASFVGTEVVGNNNQWGIFIERPAVENGIHKIADDALAEMGGSGSENISNIELTNIEWPGNWIRLKGTGTYNMGCGIFGTAEIDFRWKAALTFHTNDSLLSTKLRFYEVKPRGEEDAIQAAFCDLSLDDIFTGLFTGFTSILYKILSAVFSDPEEEIIIKEIIDLSLPQTGKLCLNRPITTTDGILIQGEGANETGSSQIITDSEFLFNKAISTPFLCYRANLPIFGDIPISFRRCLPYNMFNRV
ncbi:MAG: hypothetical protein KAQ92_00035 [Candidatus Aenigmarchaeota archaeon]|nr:hypothetical protein [Candidatus Aenigmarchaeota archaeon]